MQQRLTEIIHFLESARADLLRAYSAIPESRRAERPAADAWTPAEVLDHLALVESGAALLVEKRVSRAAERGAARDAGEDAGSSLGVLDRYGVESRERKLTAPDIVKPRAGVAAADAEAALARSREALRAAVGRADGFDLSALKATHAALGELDLYQWLLFVGKHEQRHTAQLRATEAAFAERASAG